MTERVRRVSLVAITVTAIALSIAGCSRIPARTTGIASDALSQARPANPLLEDLAIVASQAFAGTWNYRDAWAESHPGITVVSGDVAPGETQVSVLDSGTGVLWIAVNAGGLCRYGRLTAMNVEAAMFRAGTVECTARDASRVVIPESRFA